MKWFWLPFSAAFFLFSLSLQAAPLRVGNDFNGDGVSDLVNIRISEGNMLDWTVDSGSGLFALENFDRTSFGRAGHHVALARWFSPSLARLGYVRLKNSRIVWTASPAGSVLRKRTFGASSDIVVSGGDYNGNGLADAAIVRTEPDGRFAWYISADMFKRRLPLRRARHGRSGDIPFYASFSGGRDWLAVIRAGSSSDYKLYLKRAYGSGKRTVSLGAIPAGSLRPLPLPQDNGGDLLAFAKRSQTSTSFTFVNMLGQVVDETSLPHVGEVIAGNFLSATGSEIAIMSDEGITAYNPVSRESLFREWTHNIVADHININSFDPAQPDEPIGTPAPTPRSPRDNPPPAVGSLSQVCTNMHVMNRDVLYKPASQDTGDAREGKPLFMWYDAEDNPYVKQLYILASNGRQISVFGLYTPGLPPWTRFYSGYPPGLGDNSAALSAKAIAQAGNKKIYIYTENGNCWGPVPDPAGRSGGR